MGRKKKVQVEEANEEVHTDTPVEPKRVIAKVTADFNRVDLNEFRDRFNEVVDVINSK